MNRNMNVRYENERKKFRQLIKSRVNSRIDTNRISFVLFCFNLWSSFFKSESILIWLILVSFLIFSVIFSSSIFFFSSSIFFSPARSIARSWPNLYCLFFFFYQLRFLAASSSICFLHGLQKSYLMMIPGNR